MAQTAEWAAASSDVREVAPEIIHDDLDVLAALAKSIQEPSIGEEGLLELPDISASDVTRAQENIVSEIEESCTG